MRKRERKREWGVWGVVGWGGHEGGKDKGGCYVYERACLGKA